MAARLFINGRFLTQQTTGVQSFARSICAELEVVTEFTILVPANGKIIHPEFTNHILPTGNFRGHLWEQVHLPAFLRKHPGSVLLNLCNTGPAFIHNQVVTIHDLAFLKNPSWFNPAFAHFYSWLIPRLAKKSIAIVTVSESVKKELEQLFHIEHNKIYVAGNKIQQSLLSAVSTAPSETRIQPKKYFLMVGSDDPRKNFLMVEQLFTEKYPDLPLVIVGGTHRSFPTTSISQKASNSIRLGYTNEPTLKWLYENALGFINPSLYEGFGIPNLEAFAFSCPVICSDLPVFREVCGDSAFYFNPIQPNSLLEPIQYCLEQNKLVAAKTSAGKVIFTSFQNTNRLPVLLKALML